MALSNRVVLLAVIAVAGVLVLYTVFSLTNAPGSATSAVPTKFTVNGRTFVFNYTATTQAEREAGLMNKRVTSATTMLFAFPYSSTWQFWMFDTNTSLDMVWVSATGDSGRVVYVVAGAQPCFDRNSCTVYTPTASAIYVIEAKAGFSAANGIIQGTSIQFG